MVKLQKQIAYRHKGHPIYKYRVNIPTRIIEHVQWKDGQELNIHVKGHDVILCPKKE